MEVHLDRKLADLSFPAIDLVRSGTRKEELLLDNDELEAMCDPQSACAMGPAETIELLLIASVIPRRIASLSK